MTYERAEHLPQALREVLSTPAQISFMNAYNEAWIRYEDEGERLPNTSRQEMANLAGWNAIKASFQELDGQWVSK